ncbi:hypothetical protein SARI_02354 [Salmonella enterica subsp. arizonae serovar 62:z4,z23:-]|uniref:Uncharacterized protein n=1 Tax=Salmonella arizonae (strain ATCC BAA-731 / CDC346-86 / RSK2980) TaxID=41514 RepID=A9ML46_SALAR|nr:hypothetical protein SARI_02354 [Salmonella enterica subsp. arizonae serovar 62:z4,z23:-]
MKIIQRHSDLIYRGIALSIEAGTRLSWRRGVISGAKGNNTIITLKPPYPDITFSRRGGKGWQEI